MVQQYNIDKHANGDSDIVASYDSLEEAKADLDNRMSSVILTTSYSDKFYEPLVADIL